MRKVSTQQISRKTGRRHRTAFSVLVAVFLAAVSSSAVAAIILPDLPAGTPYQLVFVTRGEVTAFTHASASAANSMVQAQANQNPDLPLTTWKAVASFGGNASLNAPVFDGVPIYNLAGQLVATGSAFYSSSHLASIAYDQYGAYAYADPWTGMNPDGSPRDPVSAIAPAVTFGYSASLTGAWAYGSTTYNNMEQKSFYGLSGQLEAVPEPSTYALALAGLLCGGWQMRRRRTLSGREAAGR
jgi:hypothetical protein